MKKPIELCILLSIFLQTFAHADVIKTFKNVNYDDQYVDVEGFVLGRSCFSLRASDLSLDCNPAMLAGSTRSDFKLNLNLDNNASEVSGYINELQDRESALIIDRILKNPKPLTASESAAVWWKHEWWAMTFIPARLAVATVVTNPAYPQVTTHTSFQRELSARGGLFVSEDTNLRVGANLRFVQNNQLRQEFTLPDLFAHTADLKVRESNIVYFEPAITYGWGAAWDAQVSFVLTHLRLYESHREVPDVARPEIGYSTSPGFADGKLRTTLHYTARPDVISISERFRFGGIYEFTDELSTNFSLAGDEYGLGIMGRIDSLVLGLGYKSEVFHLNGAEIGRNATTLFQVGMSF